METAATQVAAVTIRQWQEIYHAYGCVPSGTLPLRDIKHMNLSAELTVFLFRSLGFTEVNRDRSVAYLHYSKKGLATPPTVPKRVHYMSKESLNS